MRYSSFFLGLTALVAASLLTSVQSALAISSENAFTVRSAHIVKAPGGAYITGLVQPAWGSPTTSNAQVQVTVYDVNGKVLTEQIDQVSRNRLTRWHLQPQPRASYVVFVPWSPAQISRATVTAQRGHHPIAS